MVKFTMDTKQVTWNDVQSELDKYKFPSEQDTVIVWGAGLMGQLEVPLLKNELHVIAFCDSSMEKQNSQIQGLPCIPPENIQLYQDAFVLVSTIRNYLQIVPKLEELRVGHCTVDAYVIHRHKDDLYQVYQSLDEYSQSIFSTILWCRLTGDTTYIPEICEDNQYFALPQFRFCEVDEIFVDCGAFVGDVVQKFVENNVGTFKKIFAFEPNIDPLKVLRHRVQKFQSSWLFQSDQIVCEELGVGKESSRVRFYISKQNAANCSIWEPSGIQKEINLVSLDQYFASRTESQPTFLKADIEGCEWEMLLGAQNIIQRNQPKIAISIYHNIYDFFRIPQFLKQLVPEYQFAVRHHWNSFSETVLYCYIG